MHLRRTSWIALLLIASLSVGVWTPDASARQAGERASRSRPLRFSKQSGFVGLRTLLAVATAAVMGSTCTFLPTMEGHVFPTGKDRWCTAAQVEATGGLSADYRQGIVVAAPVRVLTHTGVTWDFKTFTGVPPGAAGAPLANFLASKVTDKDLVGWWHPNWSLGGMTIESGCKGARKPWVATLAGGLDRALSRDPDGN